MPEYVEVEIEPGLTLTVEAPAPSENVLVDAGRTMDLARSAQQTFTSTLNGIRSAAETALARFRGMSERPSEVAVEFSVQLAAEAGVVIASTSATANMKVTLKWNGLGQPRPDEES